MASKNPSLNLAQAVQVFAYEVFLASAGDIPPTELEHAEVNEIEAFYGRITALLQRIGVTPYNHDWETYLKSLRRVFFADAIRRTRHRHVGHDLFDDTALHHPAQSPA